MAVVNRRATENPKCFRVRLEWRRGKGWKENRRTRNHTAQGRGGPRPPAQLGRRAGRGQQLGGEARRGPARRRHRRRLQKVLLGSAGSISHPTRGHAPFRATRRAGRRRVSRTAGDPAGERGGREREGGAGVSRGSAGPDLGEWGGGRALRLLGPLSPSPVPREAVPRPSRSPGGRARERGPRGLDRAGRERRHAAVCKCGPRRGVLMGRPPAPLGPHVQ